MCQTRPLVGPARRKVVPTRPYWSKLAQVRRRNWHKCCRTLPGVVASAPKSGRNDDNFGRKRTQHGRDRRQHRMCSLGGPGDQIPETSQNGQDPNENRSNKKRHPHPACGSIGVAGLLDRVLRVCRCRDHISVATILSAVRDLLGARSETVCLEIWWVVLGMDWVAFGKRSPKGRLNLIGVGVLCANRDVEHDSEWEHQLVVQRRNRMFLAPISRTLCCNLS